MKFSVWGSGGGEGYPALFCGCAHCAAAKRAGGKSIRTLSQAMIDDALLIDLPADTRMHLLQHGVSLDGLEHLLVTHTHTDHYVPNQLDVRGGVFARDMRADKLYIYGNADVKRIFDGIFSLVPIAETVRERIEFPAVAPYVEFTAGKYRVLPLPAKHAPEQESLNYLIDDGKRKLLYLVDSGYPEEALLSRLEELGVKLDCVAMDCTMGVAPPGTYPYHMCFTENIMLKRELKRRKLIGEHSRIIAMHITHNNAGLHEEVESILSREGIETAYDGMTAEI